MISNSKVSGRGLGHYHAREDGQEAPGHWIGQGAKELGLNGEVKRADLEAVAHGTAPNGMRLKAKRSQWRQGSYRNGHRAGTDATFSPPKSVSIIGLVGGDKRVIEAHEHAVLDTLKEIEETCSIAKIRTGGIRRNEVTGKLIIAKFDHRTTRPNDQGIPMPQIHTHSLIFNSTKCKDGKWRSLENWKFFRTDKKRLRRHYINGLGERLKEIGYRIKSERDGLHFQVEGITRSQELAYSERTKEIERELGESANGVRYKKGRFAALKTRNPKVPFEHERVHKQWKEMAYREGIAFDRVPGLVRTPKEIPLPTRVRLELKCLQISHRIKAQVSRVHEVWDKTHGKVDISHYSDADLMKLLQPKHLSDKHWNELVVESSIEPAIASASFETVPGEDAVELVLGKKLESLGGYAQQYVTKSVEGLLDSYKHLEDGGLWCPGSGEYGQLKPESPRKDEKGKTIKYENPPGVPLGVMLPEGPGIDWDEIRRNVNVPVGITEGKKKAASASSRGLNTIALSGMNGGLKNGDLRDDLKGFDWKGRKVYLVLDKDPSHKLKTLRDGARELYKLGAMLDYYGADVVIGTIPGKLKEKVGLDDHFSKGRTLADLRWRSVDDFGLNSPYLTQKYRNHNKERMERGYSAYDNPIVREDGTRNDLDFGLGR
ncbi:MobF family relaxase [Acaryochloris marina]|uniref:TrwC protein, putative n=1 Tax=Acaryochloris marina (strain MBIC 11017) TaxID=329726 RepID=A8ZPA5_ACAM1|nr:MobF family relaxase [Acaryochloris marina]ABW32841.1 TrwC protein, putative [Acaryochloris marina MBIC11017]